MLMALWVLFRHDKVVANNLPLVELVRHKPGQKRPLGLLAGKIQVDFDPLVMDERTGVEVLSFSGSDAMRLGRLPMHHRNPFDRMFAARAIANKMHLMSDDSKFIPYACALV
jgi:hypothetical protein